MSMPNNTVGPQSSVDTTGCGFAMSGLWWGCRSWGQAANAADGVIGGIGIWEAFPTWVKARQMPSSPCRRLPAGATFGGRRRTGQAPSLCTPGTISVPIPAGGQVRYLSAQRIQSAVQVEGTLNHPHAPGRGRSVEARILSEAIGRQQRPTSLALNVAFKKGQHDPYDPFSDGWVNWNHAYWTWLSVCRLLGAARGPAEAWKSLILRPISPL